MRKIHVLTRKEDINREKLTDCTAVVIDALLATSTIAAVLHHGAKEVIPVLNEQEALLACETLTEASYVLCGEKGGHTLEGFQNPDPVELLKRDLSDKSIVLSTTNGTVAVQKCSAAKSVYTSSMLNGPAVASHIKKEQDTSSVLIVCAGSDNRFSLEDFLSAGYLISELIKENNLSWKLTDSAKAAFQLYESQSHRITEVFKDTETGCLLAELGFSKAVTYAGQSGIIPIVPRWTNNRLVNAKRVSC
ncbi:2-phosphosulfolactate phosphatase [Aneurinibacillus sp. UBA3580]|jgi:2-phosphosulfolactate phosphatase|uniref:2-phosphosulfolactate phosphatase n=1 Tax=Aneurinibacillus sp. UBA3580 TaxID=1946041 RepID=UPI00257E6CAF|nr:2-phosphosulfolactate phosphatase [Aneurinibacillus sp. UBA3580]